MKLYFNIFLQIFIFFKLCNGLDRLWLIRHCDKPKSSKNPCCSELGYERAKNWYHYFKIHFKKSSIIKIYSSNFNEKKVCINNILYNPNAICQKSQRMFLTAYYLKETLQKFYKFQENININFCVGDKNNLLNDILKNKNVTDTILIWEHKEIINIIRFFGIDIKKWKNKFQNNYNIVFMIDIKTKQLFYDCFDFIENITSCPNKVDLWLNNFNKIEKKNLIVYSISANKYHVNHFFFILCIILVFFILLYLIIGVIHLIIIQRKRSEYSIII